MTRESSWRRGDARERGVHARGAIDCHIHAFPDFVHRSQDMIQIAVEASKCGMRAIAFKDHWNISATSAYLTQRYIDDMIARGELTNPV